MESADGGGETVSPEVAILFFGVALILGAFCKQVFARTPVPYTVALLMIGIVLGTLGELPRATLAADTRHRQKHYNLPNQTTCVRRKRPCPSLSLAFGTNNNTSGCAFTLARVWIGRLLLKVVFLRCFIDVYARLIRHFVLLWAQIKSCTMGWEHWGRASKSVSPYGKHLLVNNIWGVTVTQCLPFAGPGTTFLALCCACVNKSTQKYAWQL